MLVLCSVNGPSTRSRDNKREPNALRKPRRSRLFREAGERQTGEPPENAFSASAREARAEIPEKSQAIRAKLEFIETFHCLEKKYLQNRLPLKV